MTALHFMLCALLAGIASLALGSRSNSEKQQAILLPVAILVALIGVFWSSYSAWELYQAAQFPGPIQVSRPVPFGLSIVTYRALCAGLVLSPVAIIFARGRARRTTAITTAILAGTFSG
jgi:FtsH-binding integral membrane protein